MFCETGVFTPDESREILGAGRQAGMKLRIHADELVASGGSMVAADVCARSADHLIFVDDAAAGALAQALLGLDVDAPAGLVRIEPPGVPLSRCDFLRVISIQKRSYRPETFRPAVPFSNEGAHKDLGSRPRLYGEMSGELLFRSREIWTHRLR